MSEFEKRSGDDPRSKFEERRMSDRKKLIVDVHFEGENFTAIANSTDISLGGLFLKTNGFLVVGQQLIMRLTVGGAEVVLEGSVAFHEQGIGYGISFLNLSTAAESALRDELG